MQNRARQLLTCGFISICLIFLSACSSDDRPPVQPVDLGDTISLKTTLPSKLDNHTVFKFGFDPRSTPEEDARQYLPFIHYLEQSTGYHFKISFTPKGENIATRLGKGQVHFAAIGATSYIQSNEDFGSKILVRGKNLQGKAEYRTAIVTHPDSKIQSIRDIRDHHLAFGDASSTQGHLIPRIILSENNIRLEDFSRVTYTGSHLNCANAVIFQHADICGMQDTLAQQLAKENKVRILMYSDYYPSSGIAANKDVSNVVLQSVTRALLDFQPTGMHASNLHNWHLTEMPLGFIAAQEQDYQNLRNWMQKLKLKP